MLLEHIYVWILKELQKCQGPGSKSHLLCIQRKGKTFKLNKFRADGRHTGHAQTWQMSCLYFRAYLINDKKNFKVGTFEFPENINLYFLLL